jgi:hypothetical protein
LIGGRSLGRPWPKNGLKHHRRRRRTQFGSKRPFETFILHCSRPYWRCYYSNTDAIIYVVDSADRDRIGISKDELLYMLRVSVIPHFKYCPTYWLLHLIFLSFLILQANVRTVL